MTGTSFSFVIATWNSADELPGLRASVDEHLGASAEQIEWIVVDNGSTDGTPRIAAELFPECRLVALGENSGFATANNIGLREVTRPVTVLINPDCLLVDASVLDLASLAARSRALVGPRIFNADLTWQSSAHAPLATWHAIASAVIPGRLAPTTLRARLEPWRVDRRTDVGWLTAACLAAPTDILLGLGPFEDRLHMFGEDVDLGLRANRAGIRNVFAPDVAKVVHLGGRSTARRYQDQGLDAKIENRRWVIERRLGRRRLRFDDASQAMLHRTRLVAKWLLRRDRVYEAAYLRISRRLIAESRRGKTPRA